MSWNASNSAVSEAYVGIIYAGVRVNDNPTLHIRVTSHNSQDTLQTHRLALPAPPRRVALALSKT